MPNRNIALFLSGRVYLIDIFQIDYLNDLIEQDRQLFIIYDKPRSTARGIEVIIDAFSIVLSAISPLQGIIKPCAERGQTKGSQAHRGKRSRRKRRSR